MAQTDVYSPKPLQLWKTVLNWLAFLVQIFVQIIRGTPPLAQVFSYVGSTQGPFLSPPSSGFKPLSVVEIPLQQPSTAAVDVTVGCRVSDGDVEAGDGGGRSEKLTVVLDLDETLVCAYEATSLPAFVLTQATEAGLKSFDLECVSSEKERDGKPKINYVTVFERPGLHEFLEQLSEFADLVLFTAGLEGYAKPLVDRIDLKNLFSRRFYRPSTVSTEYRDHVKDLSCITKDLCRVVIVDNNPFSFLLQPLNGIPCVPFAAGQPQDEQLLEVLLPLLKDLSQQKDVRPMLYDKFHMPEWFQNHGIPASLWPL
ncbi:hypothetical protein Nepgr_017241 [Nepenthes gracilis]|uniref:FCP1 homology domain-containing protein n=1 Tax=Nepenthes gracilis TaxID=150966 RepID=A0AAD3SR39_NEPGR|nr:hypothetical protein Nepgr_017241 [Nepenthes gracilis]